MAVDDKDRMDSSAQDTTVYYNHYELLNKLIAQSLKKWSVNVY